MLEKLTIIATRRGDAAVARHIKTLAATPAPPGVAVEATSDGVTLSGKNLRRRMLSDAALRSFGR